MRPTFAATRSSVLSPIVLSLRAERPSRSPRGRGQDGAGWALPLARGAGAGLGCARLAAAGGHGQVGQVGQVRATPCARARRRCVGAASAAGAMDGHAVAVRGARTPSISSAAPVVLPRYNRVHVATPSAAERPREAREAREVREVREAREVREVRGVDPRLLDARYEYSDDDALPCCAPAAPVPPPRVAIATLDKVRGRDGVRDEAVVEAPAEPSHRGN